MNTTTRQIMARLQYLQLLQPSKGGPLTGAAQSYFVAFHIELGHDCTSYLSQRHRLPLYDLVYKTVSLRRWLE